MPRLLIIGDLHVKTFLLPFIDQAIEQIAPDRVIVLGDYMDDWGVSSAVNLMAARKIITWAHRHDNITLLFGNHDMAYYSGSGNCAGNDWTIKSEAYLLFAENLDIMQVATSAGGWLITHSGLCRQWEDQCLAAPQSAHLAAVQINELLETSEGRRKLEMVGRHRGGYDWPSPLWADWSELTQDYYFGFNQIVGHTPQATCIHKITRTGEQLWCCDTFSSASSGHPLGDYSMLLLDTEANTVTVVEQPDQTGVNTAYRQYSTEDHLGNRAARASRAKFDAALTKVPDVEPESFDKIG